MSGVFIVGFNSGRGEVLQVEWDPNHEAVLASSSDDRRVMIWDLNRYFTQHSAENNLLGIYLLFLIPHISSQLFDLAACPFLCFS